MGNNKKGNNGGKNNKKSSNSSRDPVKVNRFATSQFRKVVAIFHKASYDGSDPSEPEPSLSDETFHVSIRRLSMRRKISKKSIGTVVADTPFELARKCYDDQKLKDNLPCPYMTPQHTKINPSGKIIQGLTLDEMLRFRKAYSNLEENSQ